MHLSDSAPEPRSLLEEVVAVLYVARVAFHEGDGDEREHVRELDVLTPILYGEGDFGVVWVWHRVVVEQTGSGLDRTAYFNLECYDR